MKRQVPGILWLVILFLKSVSVKSQIHPQLGGMAALQVKYYGITGKNPTSRQPFVVTFNARPVLKIGRWTIDSRFVLGNYQTSFRDYNRYGIQPHSKNWTAYLGHSTLSWSPLVLDGRPILGAGAEFHPGKWRAGVFAGRANRASVQDTFRNRVFSPVFQRMVYAMKLGYGPENRFLEVIALVGQDNASSLKPIETKGTTPASNAVLGLHGLTNIGRHLRLNADATWSAFTQNQNAKGSETGVSTAAKIPGNFIQTNSSTQFCNAVQSRLDYLTNPAGAATKGLMGDAHLEYIRIDPQYQSMGLYFLMNDVERIKLGGGIGPASKKWQLNASIGMEQNDLLNTQQIRSKRLINGINLMLRPGNKWNIQAVVQNYAAKLLAETINSTDTLLINQVNRSYLFSANGIQGESSNKLLLSLGYQSGRNVIPSATTRNIAHSFLQASWSQAQTGSRWALSPSYSVHRYIFVASNTTRHIPTLGLDKSMLNKKLQMHVETGLILTWFQKKFNTFGWRNAASLTWQTSKKSYLAASAYAQPNLQSHHNFTEFQADVRLGVRF